MTDRELTFLLQKYETFEREVISPASSSRVAPFDVGWCPVNSDLRASAAAELDFSPVRLGFRWGPAWTRGWFRLTAPMPTDAGSLAVRFDCGTEALLFDGDRPWQGFDANRDAAPLPPSATVCGGELELMIEAECMHPWGVRAFSWDVSETHKRWGSDDPGHLTLAELATSHEAVQQLAHAFRFARQLLAEVGLRSTTGRLVQQSIERCLRVLDDSDVAATAEAGLAELHASLAAGADAGASEAVAVGHAHIDTAWLWTLDHTRRKCQRSWANVLRLMERYDDFSFLCSQAAQYAMVERDAPEQFNEIARRVAEGRWEPFGSMWVEPDCSVPSGESLIRQVALGCGYWRNRFGEIDGTAIGHGVCFLPDTFGFPATLPTILSACGIHTFITNKLSWNQTNPMPHTSFDWIGPDGSTVLAHLTPGGDYNATNSPKELIKGERVGLAAPPADQWLQPFGFGDGGGGPTAQHIESARLASNCPGLPRVTLANAAAFVESLRRAHQESDRLGEPWPSWRGDLYLELHRGTFTTQRRLKQLNHRAEESLREAEMLSCFVPAQSREPVVELWKTLLTNQFHDILPGSSITEVNRQAETELERVCMESERIAHKVLGEAESVGVWNPASSPACGVLEIGDRLVLVRDAPPAALSKLQAVDPRQPVRASRSGLDNGLIRIELDDAGQIASLRSESGDELAGCPLHRYRLFRDRPHMWDAWEIDPGYESAELQLEPSADTTLVLDDPLRGVIEASRAVGEHSAVTTRYILDADSPVLGIEMDIEWQESRRLLRVDYPTSICNTSAVTGTQFGFVERSTHRNTSWDRARFEVPAHRFVSLGQPGLGIAVLAADVHGWSCHGSTISASLLRSPVHPDPTADRGRHRIKLGIYPHGGNWREAAVSSTAERFARPLRAVSRSEHGSPLAWETEGACAVELSALMPDQTDAGCFIARFVEVQGGAGAIRVTGHGDIRSIVRTDALASADLGTIVPGGPIPVRAGQILTLRILRGR